MQILRACLLWGGGEGGGGGCGGGGGSGGGGEGFSLPTVKRAVFDPGGVAIFNSSHADPPGPGLLPAGGGVRRPVDGGAAVRRSGGRSLHSLWRIPTAAAIPHGECLLQLHSLMENPYHSCNSILRILTTAAIPMENLYYSCNPHGESLPQLQPS